MRMIIILCLLLTGQEITSQSLTPDSLLNTLDHAGTDTARFEALKQLVIFYKNRNIDSSRWYIEQAKDIARTRFPYGYHSIIFFEAEVAFNQGEYDEALAGYHTFLKYHMPRQNLRDLAEGFNGISLVHLYNGNHDSSMHYSLECLPIFEDLGDTVGQIQALYRIGQVKAQIDEHKEAQHYLTSGLILAEAIEHGFYVPAGYNGLATVLLYQSEDLRDSSEVEYIEMQAAAREKYVQALDGFKALGIAQYEAAITHNLGLIELNLENWQAAKDYITSSLKLAGSYANPRQRHAKESSLAVALFRLGDFQEAESMLKDGLVFYREKNDMEGKQSNLGRLRDLYTQRRDFAQALSMTNQLLDVQKELFESSKTRQVEELEIKYEAGKKEQEVVLLNAQNEAASLRLKSSRRLSIGLGFISLVFILFAIVLYRLNKKINAQKNLISKALSEKDILLREIHHRVKNNLQVISSLLNLQSRHLEDGKAQVALKEGQNRVRSMALIHQKLYQEDNLTGIHVQDYLTRLTRNLFASYNVNVDRVQLDLAIDNLNIDVDTLIPLGLIVNELITNALKYAFPEDQHGTIVVRLSEENGHLWLRVHDDGIGLDEHRRDKLESSFGYQMINVFTSQLDADLRVRSEKGTQVDLYIKDYKMVS